MAATYDVTLVGGPCNGETVTVSAAELNAGRATCKGNLYLYLPDTHDPWLFQYAPDKAKGVPPGDVFGGSTVAASFPGIFGGWQDLRQSINVRLPAALRKARTSDEAALRALSRLHRIG